MRVRYSWTLSKNAIKRFGREHTGTVAHLGRKWVKLVNDDDAISAIWPFDEVEYINIAGEVA